MKNVKNLDCESSYFERGFVSKAIYIRALKPTAKKKMNAEANFCISGTDL